MKKLIFKCALLSLIVGGLLFLGGTAYKQTNTYRNLERTEETEKFHNMPKHIDIAVFGPSHGRDAFKYPPKEKTLFNFSLSSQTPQYDAALLRQYQDDIAPNALVVFTFSYLSPYWTDTEEVFQSKQSRYYRILSPKNIVDVDLCQYWLEYLSPLLTLAPNDVISAFLTNPPLVSSYDERTGNNQLSAENIPSEQARIEKDHWSTAIAPTYPEVNPVMWSAYHEMLDLCQEKGWNAVLVTPPYLSEYNSCFPNGFYESFLFQAEKLAEEYDIPYLNYSHNLTFADRRDLFRDIDHLNLEGAKIFNEQFFTDIQALDLLA